MPTANLQELNRQIAELQKQANELREQEMNKAIETVKDLVATFGLTAEQIGVATARVSRVRAVAAPKRTRPGIAKYADPATGKTWTGFGKPPGWIAAAKDRTTFLIAPAAASRGTAAPRKAAAKKTRAKS